MAVVLAENPFQIRIGVLQHDYKYKKSNLTKELKNLLSFGVDYVHTLCAVKMDLNPVVLIAGAKHCYNELISVAKNVSISHNIIALSDDNDFDEVEELHFRHRLIPEISKFGIRCQKISAILLEHCKTRDKYIQDFRGTIFAESRSIEKRMVNNLNFGLKKFYEKNHIELKTQNVKISAKVDISIASAIDDIKSFNYECNNFCKSKDIDRHAFLYYCSARYNYKENSTKECGLANCYKHLMSVATKHSYYQATVNSPDHKPLPHYHRAWNELAYKFSSPDPRYAADIATVCACSNRFKHNIELKVVGQEYALVELTGKALELTDEL